VLYLLFHYSTIQLGFFSVICDFVYLLLKCYDYWDDYLKVFISNKVTIGYFKFSIWFFRRYIDKYLW